MNLFRTQIPHILAEFDHLPFNTHGERLYNWLYPEGRRTCIQCGAAVKFHNLSSGGYREFCSCGCRAKHFKSNENGLTPAAIQAKKVTAALKTPEQWALMREKQRATIVARGINPNQGYKFKEHARRTYGVDSVNQRHYTPDTIHKLSDEQWLREEYYTKKRSVEDIRTEFEHPISPTPIISAITRFNIPRHYVNHRSVGEREVENFVRDLGFDVEVSDRTLISPHELDIVIHSKKLAVEYCGLYWHSTANARMTPSYHANKMKAVNARGYRLVTIFEDEWKNSRHAVEQKLRSILGVSIQPVVYARKCQIVLPSREAADRLLDTHHIQGISRHTISYGLTHSGELVAVMLMLRIGDEWDLVRYATSCRVIGGMGKLWSAFARDYPGVKVKTFADLRYSHGGMYETLGFTLDGVVKPDYYYVISGRREHKFNYRHTGRLGKMKGYDPTRSERENADALGLCRIYNCGLLRYVKYT